MQTGGVCSSRLGPGLLLKTADLARIMLILLNSSAKFWPVVFTYIQPKLFDMSQVTAQAFHFYVDFETPRLLFELSRRLDLQSKSQTKVDRRTRQIILLIFNISIVVPTEI